MKKANQAQIEGKVMSAITRALRELGIRDYPRDFSPNDPRIRGVEILRQLQRGQE